MECYKLFLHRITLCNDCCVLCCYLQLLAAFGGKTLPSEYAQRPVNEDSCLAMLLPSLRDFGLCSLALLYFLYEKQNDFLERYAKLRKTK